MVKFMNLWHFNPSAPFPTDPSKYLELMEMMFATMDGMMKRGEIEEWGVFPEGYSGYAIGKGEIADVSKNVIMFHPYILSEIHEIISYEKSKETLRAVLKARIAAMKK
jgi:hypothetical protein